MSEDKVINELTKIKGLSKKQAVKLYRAGITSIKKLGSSNPDELSKITGIARKQLTTWVILARAQERKKFIEVDAAAEELSQLIEIRLEDAKKLVSAGVMSIEDLADESPDLLAEDTGFPASTISSWIKKSKDVKKLPPEKRKVVVVPSAEVSFGSKLPGAFLGSGDGFYNIYNSSSSFGQSFVFVLITGIFLWLYLSMSQATLGGWSITQLWEYTTLLIDKIVFEVAGLQITFYPLVFIAGLLISIVIWFLFGKIVSSAKNLEFKNTSAVLGFAFAPGILIIVVIMAKFLPLISGDLRLYVLPGLLIAFSAWTVIVFLRGIIFSPRSHSPSEISAAPSATTSKIAATSAAAKSDTVLEVVEERAPPTFSAPPTAPAAAPPIAAPPTAVAPPTAPARSGPLNLSEFGTLVDANSLGALQQAGFNTSLDLLRATSKDISERTGIQQSKIIILRIISDLLRIPDISLEAALILTKSGVRSVKHLSKINENALKVQVLDTISKENIPTTITAQMLGNWIQKARSL
jgi:hypothetical protein